MRTVFVLLLLAASLAGLAQLYVGTGTQLQLTGSAQLTLRDLNFVNNGSFSAGNSTVTFNGTADVTVSGTNPIQFYLLDVNKSGGRILTLQRTIGVSGEMKFSQGYLNLNSYDLDLGSNGMITGESETSRFTGASGGEIICNVLLNAPSNANPGNLGAFISSTQNLGNVIVRRGHLPKSIEAGNSILRYYTITPSNNTLLNATLRFKYFDAELNGRPENTLALWRSIDGINWSYQSFSVRDAAQNHVEKTAIDAFSTWTLATQSAALPVIFTAFNLQCSGDKAILRWTTAQEFNSSHFVIEKNTPAGWANIGSIPAAGNSNAERNYEFTDINLSGKSLYRIAQYDIDGRVKYTNIIIADCQLTDALQVWPNPFEQAFSVKINSNSRGAATLKLIDATGRVVVNNKIQLQNGSNQFEVDMQHTASGTYLLTLEWAEGKMLKTMRLIKK